MRAAVACAAAAAAGTGAAGFSVLFKLLSAAALAALSCTVHTPFTGTVPGTVDFDTRTGPKCVGAF